MTVFDQVAEFHRAFSIPIFDNPTPADPSLQKLRMDLLDEEYKELLKAYEENDLIEIADALADITYIICGTAHSYGIALNNGWEPPYTDVMPRGEVDIAEVEMHMTVLQLLYEAYQRYEKHKHYDGIRDSLFAMMTEICYLADLIGIPFKKVFDEVQRSNMAKLMPDGSVLRRDDGKVKKPPSWTPPDIRSILYPTKEEFVAECHERRLDRIEENLKEGKRIK